MAYEGHCGSCLNFEDMHDNPYDKTNADYVKGYCTYYRACYYPDDQCDSHYRPRSGSTGSCYITTMICGILGKEDTCESLNTLREFRNNVLQKDQKYAGILYEYDVVGPKIADELKKEDKSFVQGLYDGFILPIVSKIQNHQVEEAVSSYITMTKSLEDCYGISFEKKVPMVYDAKKGGHGVYQKKKYKVVF